MELLFTPRLRRKLEKEADLIGLMLMNKAGFNMREAVNLWKRVQNSSIRPAEYISSHPQIEDRIDNISQWIDDIRRGVEPRL